MRDGLLRGLIAGLCGLVVCGAAARAQAPSLAVTLEPPASLAEGDRAELIATVRLSPPTDLPVLVTPTSEGRAVEVVRGRLVRADAEDPSAETLRFRVPIVARGAGTAVVRVRASGWVCERRCRPVAAEQAVVLRVDRAPR